MSAEKINIIVTEKALTALNEAITKVEQLKKGIELANSVSSSTAYTASLKQQALETKILTDQIILNEKAEQARLNTEIKANNSKKSSIALSEAERRATNAQTADVNRQVLANERLNSAYNKLNKARTDAKNTLRDLVSGQEVENKTIGETINKISLLKKKYEENAIAIRKSQEWLLKNASNEKISGAKWDNEDKAKQRLIATNQKLIQSINKENQTLSQLPPKVAASTAEINKAQKAFDILDQKVRKADRAVGDMSKNVGNYKSAFSGLSNLMGAFGIGTGLYLAVDIAKNIYETTKQLQSLDLALKMVSETSAIYASNTAFITQISAKWGIEIKGLTEQFTQFYVNAKGKLSEVQIKETFEGIAKAGSLMGISIDKQNDAFYAFNQMLSKGTVQAEELKKQLGNALPGAIKAATMAYQELHPELKVTEQMMLDQMKAGKLVSNEMVPAIIRAYQKLYGIEMVDKVDTLAAAQNRLKNSWTDLVRSMNESKTGGISSFFKFIMQGLDNGLKLLTRFNSSWDELYKKASVKGKSLGATAFTERMDKAGFGGSTESDKAQMVLDVARKELLILKEQERDINKKIQEHEGEKAYLGLVGEAGVSKRAKEEKEQILLDIAARIEIIRLSRTQLGLNKELNKTKVGGDGKTSSDTSGTVGIKGIDEETKSIKENTKAKRENIESVGTLTLSKDEDTALERLKLLKSALEKTRDETSKNANEFRRWEQSIKDVDGAIDVFTKDLKTDVIGELEEKVKAYNDGVKQSAQDAKDALKDQIRLFNEFAGDFANKSGFSQTFDNFLKEDKNGVSLMDTLFDDTKVMDKEAKMKATFLAISSAAQDMFNLISDASQRNFDAEYARLEKQKEVSLRFAGDSDAAKKKIEEDYEKRRKQIAVREFKAKQKIAMVNIAIDTAQAIMATLGKGGFFASPLAMVVAAMGAIQLAMVATQKVPEFWRGTKNAPAGVAWTNEKGAEIHTDRHGNIKDFGHNKGATLTKMDAGDIVYTAEETRRMMFENEYNGLLAKNGITGAKVEVKNGMTAIEMDEVLSKHFSQIQTNTTVIDRNGLSQWSERNGNRTIEHSNRVSRTGFRI